MTDRWSAARLAPFVAGLAGLAWFWLELEPTRTGFEDNDNPATGLQFIAAHPQAWPLAGLALSIAAIALVATVIATRDRLEGAASGAPRDAPAEGPADAPGVASRAIAVIGLFAALFLLGHAATRLAGGPVRYVQGLDQAWGETAYLVTQFVGVQLFGVAGLSLLSLWVVSVAWLGARRRALPTAVAVLALLPAVRVAGIPGLVTFIPWPLWALAIPATFLWLILLGVWPAPAARNTSPSQLATAARL